MTFAGLFILTTIYAVILDRYKERWEPDWTWLEVVVGVALCLWAAAIHARIYATSWHDYETAVWWAFIVGGAPMIIWRVWRMITSRDEALTYERTKTLAQKTPKPREAKPRSWRGNRWGG